MKRILLVFGLIFSMMSFVYADWDQAAKLLASEGAESDEFGFAVAIDNNYCIVGAYHDSDNGGWSGSAYIFIRSGASWVQQMKLVPDDGETGDMFGASVSIHGDYALIGALWDDDQGSNSGSAYIFKRDGNNWIQQAKLIANDGKAGDNFGVSVSIHNNYALIGASYDGVQGGPSNSGSAYVFKRDGNAWTQQEKITANDAATSDEFGNSVSIYDEYAIVGSHKDDSETGSAYIFKRNVDNWVQQSKLTANDAAVNDYFGTSVSIDGNYALIGAILDDDLGSNSGSAYIFKRDGDDWIQHAKLTADGGASDDNFGTSVSIDNEYAIIGSDGDLSRQGSAYIFKRDGSTWSQLSKLTAADGSAVDDFGTSVSISGDCAIVGANLDDDQGDASGSAYIFENTSEQITWDGSISTDWETAGNWDSDAVPTSTDNVIIASSGNNPVVGSDDTGDCNDLTIENGAALTINSGGSLITNGVITNNGTINVERSISDDEWHLISSPISSAAADMFDGNYLQYYDNGWVDITDPAVTMTPAKGYSLWSVAKSTTFTFSGDLNTGDQSLNTVVGWNLLGNPYPSPIDWAQLDDTYGAVYYWDAAAGNNKSWIDGGGGIAICACHAGILDKSHHCGYVQPYK